MPLIFMDGHHQNFHSLFLYWEPILRNVTLLPWRWSQRIPPKHW